MAATRSCSWVPDHRSRSALARRERDDDGWLAGVDGCRVGWVAAFVRPAGEETRVRVVPRFADVLDVAEAPDIVAVDVPIGLPERICPGGRGPEAAVRKQLGRRQSSVFSVPARAAVYADTFGEACRIGFETSEPPRKISKQLFMIAPKIREVDAALRADAARAARVFEVHPEVAFWRLNGNRPLDEPKKIKGVPYAPGLALRRALLVGAGFAPSCVEAVPPKGARPDDLLDALACAAIARCIYKGVAQPFPDPPGRDDYGLSIAIWA
jgi:predicted RNase H-like nuclease